MVDRPSEIASWLFPHEPEEDEQRTALKQAIERMVDRRIAGELVAGRGNRAVARDEDRRGA
jgi:hypothetical protein